MLHSWGRWTKRMVPQVCQRGRARPPVRSCRPHLERLEDRLAPTVSVLSNYAGVNFVQASKLQDVASTAPDTCGAAGPSSYVETVNLELRLFPNKTNSAKSVTDGLKDFFFTRGHLFPIDGNPNNPDGMIDPTVIYDEFSHRFIVGAVANDTRNTNYAFVLAVSTTDDPKTLDASSWNFTAIPLTESAVIARNGVNLLYADYPGNMGYNADAVVITLDEKFLNPDGSPTEVTDHVQIVSISQASLEDPSMAKPGHAPLAFGTDYFRNDTPENPQAQGPAILNLRPTTMHDARPGDPMWLLGDVPNPNAQIDIFEMTTSALLTSASSPVSLPVTRLKNAQGVNPFDEPGLLGVAALQPPPRPGAAAPPVGLGNALVLKAAEANDTIVACQTVAVNNGTQTDVRWYTIHVDDASTPAFTVTDSGDIAPTLVTAGPGTKAFCYFPSIDINSEGDIGLSYIQSGTDKGDFMSVWVTGRKGPNDLTGTTDPVGLGKMETPVLLKAGAADYNLGGADTVANRAGDLSGISVDPGGSFWVANEYADAPAKVTFPFPPPFAGAPVTTKTAGFWGTAIGQFSFALTAAVSNNVLQVTGYGGSDNVKVLINPTSTQVFAGTTPVGKPFDNGTFSSIQIALGPGDDKLTVATAGGASLPSGGISYDGGAGNNTLVVPGSTNTWHVSGPDAGDVNGVLSFTNVQDLTGGTGGDTFVFSDGAGVTGTVDGGVGTGANKLDYSAYTTAVTVNLAANTATGTGGISHIKAAAGGSASDTLIGPSGANAWHVTGANAGDVSGKFSFTSFEDLTGGTGNDTFAFSDGAGVDGAVDGAGGSKATDTLDYSKYTTAVTVNLAAGTATGTGGVSNVGKAVGGKASNTLAGPDSASTWHITGANAGDVSGTFQFSAFGNLTGGGGDDTFVFSNAKGVTGTVSGGGGSNWLDYSAYAASVKVNLATGTATGTGGVSSVENVIGGKGNDTLTGDAAGNVLVGGGGKDTITGGDGRSILIGGAGADTITGGAAGDIVIQGTTTFGKNTVALDALLEEWRRSISYDQRLNDLGAGVTDAKGNTDALAAGTTGATVTKDKQANTLAGEPAGGSEPGCPERDWFFVNLAKDLVPDLTADQAAGEQFS